MMFWLDMVLTLTLPVVAMGLVGVVVAVVMRYTAFSSTAAYAPTRPGGAREKAPRHGHRVHVNGWESPLDAEIQRLKRKNMGL